LIRDLVERLHTMGLCHLVPIALLPEDGEGRICCEPGYKPLYTHTVEGRKHYGEAAPTVPFREADAAIIRPMAFDPAA
ncbi:MAG: hypothetical protein ACREI7_13360, partial [Myxococcota bacterium]